MHGFLSSFRCPGFQFHQHPSATSFHLPGESVVQRRDNRQPYRRPPRPDNLRILEPNTHIPSQMPESIVAVVEKRERKEGLEAHLDRQRPRRHRRNHRLRLHGQVREAEQVERSGENDGGQAVEAGTVPGDLRLIDGEMRGDGALETLFGEDLGGFGLGGCESVFRVSTGLESNAVVGVLTSAAPCCVPRAALSLPALPPVANQAGRCA
jgi:hypothetical protein